MTDIRKASEEAVEAARQSEQFAVVLAAVQAAKAMEAERQPAPQPIVIQQSGQAGKWLAIAAGGSVFLMTLAVCAVAVAIAAAAVALVAVVVWAIWRDVRGPRR